MDETANATAVKAFLQALLMNAALQLNTQAIANHQTSSHLMDLSFVNLATKMDIAESFAAQGLAAAHLPREAAGLNLAAVTPKKPTTTTGATT